MNVRFALVFLFTAVVARGEELLGPADYVRILGESKLRYRMLSTPSKTAVEPPGCPRRDQSLRVVAEGAEKKLVAWPVSAEATTLMEAGEGLFQSKDFEGAAAKFKAALAADPQAVGAYMYAGDALLFGPRDAAAALELYRQAIALDPTLPTPHFFAANAYARLGRLAEARAEVVEALTHYPGYEVVLRIATERPGHWGIQPLRRHPFQPPAGMLGKDKDGVEVFGGADAQWLGYALCKAAWANEPQFTKSEGWSLQEERACVLNQVMSAYNATEARLEKEKKPTSADAVRAAMPELERHLFAAASEKLLDGYILYEVLGQRCPLGMSLLDDRLKDPLRNYIRRYIVVAAEK